MKKKNKEGQAMKSDEGLCKEKKTLIKALDQNGDGRLDSVDLILIALKVPGVRINRAEFLRKEFFKNYSEDVVNKAIETTPAKAGIKTEDVDKIADEVIKFERNAVSGISAVLGLPGGVAMAATIPADIAQYYGYMLRCAQKLLYLYGFPEIMSSDNSLELDTETINQLTICLGIMYGVAGANNALKAMAKALSAGVEKKLLNTALTKGTIYPIVKAVAKWFNVRMTKTMFADFFKKTIPVLGSVIGGGLTFVTFKPCCCRLQKTLQDTMLSNPEHKETDAEKEMYDKIKNDVIDVETEELVEIEEDTPDEEIQA